MYEGSIKIRISPEVSEIERLNRLVRQFGELHEIPSRTLYSINLALDELVTNSVVHGTEHSPTQEPVEVLLETVGQDLIARVTDGGREFNPLEVL